MFPFRPLLRVYLHRLLTLVFAGATCQSVYATTLIVTSMADSGPGSLRDTIAAASNGDIIQFAPALNGQTIRLTSAGLTISRNLTIEGPGANQLTVERSHAPDTPEFPIFFVIRPAYSATIADLTIANGNGGIWTDAANLTITNCVI